ncbi:ArsR/SmtB family transcription factor [Solicola gregarius]|uniref:Metalloregulator ArsR/SmtB family transcription factor n=1 Tax=Solicola gregarius TaxID=2908642 RepID=A0AA46TE22_9ACTN|nr:metalloregulator ArsR/SmtB family transcription factor [Solicola gregarius]UYM03395.1 metalloregulator ArsR/SmtB family transcription factor [Solicola gregarius]
MPAVDIEITDHSATCATSLTATPIAADEAADLARTFKAVADPARLRLLSIIASHEGGEACACDLNEPLGLSQPTVSHHLKVLVGAGLLEREQRGVWAFYSVVPERLDTLAGVLSTQA